MLVDLLLVLEVDREMRIPHLPKLASEPAKQRGFLPDWLLYLVKKFKHHLLILGKVLYLVHHQPSSALRPMNICTFLKI